MSFQKIAIPSNNPGGLDGQRSDHFGHCDVFTVVEFQDNEVSRVEIVSNGDHHGGGCMAPVRMLADKKVDGLVVSGIGKRPLQGCRELGIQVYFADKNNYKDIDGVVKGVMSNSLPLIQPEQACKGHANCEAKGIKAQH